MYGVRNCVQTFWERGILKQDSRKIYTFYNNKYFLWEEELLVTSDKLSNITQSKNNKKRELVSGDS